jgi:predicted  nucleic acid-binding Zn-ribbon protein
VIYNPIMSAALGLYRLQQIDTQIDQARLRLEGIRQTIENDMEFQEATELTSNAMGSHKAAEQDQRQVEMEVKSQRIKIEQAEASLYGGNVRNPKELQDLQQDVASLKKHLITLEDRLLESMFVTENTASTLSKTLAVLSTVETNRGDQIKNLTAEQDIVTRNLERLEAERKAAIAPIDGKLLDTYESLRRERRGIAVTTVGDGACSACGTTLTPGQQQTARSSREIFRCTTCGRILFAD